MQASLANLRSRSLAVRSALLVAVVLVLYALVAPVAFYVSTWFGLWTAAAAAMLCLVGALLALVLSHLDNWCDVRYPLRAMPYRLVNLLAARHYPDVPRVAIMHGTPDDEGNRAGILNLLARTPGGAPFLVCNSRQAVDE